MRFIIISLFVLSLSFSGHAQEDGDSYFSQGMNFQKGEGIEKAGEMFGKAAELGSESAIQLLEQEHQNCRTGIKQSKTDDTANIDYTKFLDSCRLFAASGDIETQFILGVVYLQGKMVEPSAEKSTHWFYQAAKQGHVVAQYEMAKAYLKGVNDEGGEADQAVAYGWLCALEKQSNTPGSPGLKMWQGMGVAADAQKLKAKFDDKAEKTLIRGPIMKNICDGYVKDFYKDPKGANASKN